MAATDERLPFEQDFESLFRAHYPSVLGYALRRAPAEAARDVAAETFLVAWRRFAERPDEELAWLLAIARRTLANQRRGERRRLALTSRLNAGGRRELPVLDPELDPLLVRALERLPASQREALLLTAWEGLEPESAAVALGCSPGAFRVRLHRARRRVARELERGDLSLACEGPDEPPPRSLKETL